MQTQVLNNFQFDKAKSRFPNFELSYESMLHNTVPDKYNLAIAIPIGKKYIAWFSFFEDKNVLFLLEISKDKRYINCVIYPCEFDEILSFGTIFYGIYLSDFNVFIIEDIHYYKGIHISKNNTITKLMYINDILQKYIFKSKDKLNFALPYFSINFNSNTNFKNIDVPYTIHHIQYRSLYSIVPYLNTNPNNNSNKNEDKKLKNKFNIPIYVPVKCDFRKPQYKLKSTFIVTADIQYDIYHLFAYGRAGSTVYYNTAFIPDYKTSVFMNKIFRKIKENDNLDYIEESDDEEDFQDVNEDKYVDLNKSVKMLCQFSVKFKRWIPLKIYNDRVVHIHTLTKNFNI